MERSNTRALSDWRSIGRRRAAMLGIMTSAVFALCIPLAWQGAPVAAQSPGELQGLGIVTGTVLLALVGASLAFFQRYDLTRKRQAEIRRQLDARQEAELQRSVA